MDYISDDFISYNDVLAAKQEKSLDHDLRLGSLSRSEMVSPFSISIPPNLQNLFASNETPVPVDPSSCSSSAKISKKRQPFYILKAKKGDSRHSSTDTFQVKIEADEKISTKTKLIMKREKAKQRLRVKQEPTSSIADSTAKLVLEDLNGPEFDGKTKKKMVQMIRNRISAQNSRDRKKAYVVQLEEARSMLEEDKAKLIQENSLLLKELKKLGEAQKKLKLENQELKRKQGIKEDTSKNCAQQNMNLENNDEKNIEDENPIENLSGVLKSLTEPNFSRLSTKNKNFLHYTIAFATIISIIMMMNFAQQGNIIPQGGIGRIQGTLLARVERKILQQAALVEEMEENVEELISVEDASLFNYVKPTTQNIELKHKKSYHESQNDIITEATPNLKHTVKLEDLGIESICEDNGYSQAQNKMPLYIEDENYLVNRSHKDNKQVFRTSTYLDPNTFGFANDEERMASDDQEDQDFGLFESTKVENFSARHMYRSSEKKYLDDFDGFEVCDLQERKKGGSVHKRWHDILKE